MNRRTRDFDSDELGFLKELAASAHKTGRPSSVCPSPERLQARSVGALPDEERPALDLHLRECVACRLMVQDLAQWQTPAPGKREVRALWQRLEKHVPRKRRARAPWRVWTSRAWLPAAVVAAAALVLAVNLVRMLRSSVGPPPPLHASVASPHYDLGAMAAVEKAPVRLPAAGLLLWRGSGPSSVPASTRELAAALVPYQGGDYPQAAKQLATLASRYPRSFEVTYYWGVSLLLLERASEAVARLTQARALGDPAQRAEASWYLAVAHLRSGSIGPARAHLEELCSSGAGHSASACGVLRQLVLPAFAPPRK